MRKYLLNVITTKTIDFICEEEKRLMKTDLNSTENFLELSTIKLISYIYEIFVVVYIESSI